MTRSAITRPVAALLVTVLVGLTGAPAASGQSVKSSRRGTAVKGEEGHGAAVGPRGAAVKGEEGYAAVGRRGVVAGDEEGATAAGRRGAVAVGENGAAAASRRGVVVAGEEGYAAAGRYGGVVVGNRYESYEGWKVAAGVGAAIAIGTMLAKPPKAAAPVVVTGTTYYYADNVFYARAFQGDTVVYQVVAPPAGAVIPTLPAGCTAARVGDVVYQQCGTTHFQPVSGGYKVVVIK